MDPLSITTGCLALISTLGRTTIAITKFVRSCREARTDLAAITREISELHMVLELLKDDVSISDKEIIPESLQAQVLSIIANCAAVVAKINATLETSGSRTDTVKWVAVKKSEVAGLRMSLEAHRTSLNLVLELVSVSIIRAVKEDTTVMREDVAEIKQDTTQIPQIMEELTRLRAFVARLPNPAAAGGHNYVLEKYIDGLTSYAETVCGDIAWSDADNEVDEPQNTTSTELQSDVGSPDGQGWTPGDASRENTPPQIIHQSGSISDTGSDLGEVNISTRQSNRTDQINDWLLSLPTSNGSVDTAVHAANPICKRVVIVGDRKSGKTALYTRARLNFFYTNHTPTGASTEHCMTLQCDGKVFKLILSDTSGMEDHDTGRTRQYPRADVILLCFNIGEPDSADNVKEKWIREIGDVVEGVPIVLVGLKSDLRSDPRTIKHLARIMRFPLTTGQGRSLERATGAKTYLECSAKTGRGVQEVMQAAARATLLDLPEVNMKEKPPWTLFGASR